MDASTDDGKVATFSRRRKGKSRDDGKQGDLGVGVYQQEKTRVSTPEVFGGVYNVKRLPRGDLGLAKSKPKKKKMTQMFLDVGQRDFYSTQCVSCGFVYTRGNRDEERLHDAHHREALCLEGLKLRNIPLGATLMARDAQGAIYKVHYSAKGTDVGGIKPFVDRICKMVEGEMGTVHGWVSRNDAIVFMYINAQREMIGCVILEPSPVTSHGARFTGMKSKSGIVVKQNGGACGKKKKCQCAVRLMWTLSSYRRKKVTSKLLDCARAQLISGQIVPRANIAFSQPTELGTLFIQQYTNSSEFFVYDVGNQEG